LNKTLEQRRWIVILSLKRGLALSIAGAVLGFLMVFPLIAHAAPPKSCRTVEKKIQSKEGVHSGLHIGVKSNLNFGSPNNDCVRVSTIGIISVNQTGFVEWGWVLGYDGAPCGDNYHSTPTLFVSWQNSGGAVNCTVHFGNASQYFTVEASDLNQDNVWKFFKAGTQIDSKNMVFHRGDNFLLTERNNNSDSGFGDFQALKKALTSGGGSFTNFTSPGLQADLDDGYKFCKVSDTHVKHIANAASCP
jgi:hypothetical protein